MSAPIEGASTSSIGSAAIVPDAEPKNATGASSVSATQEEAFFNRGKANHELLVAQANLGVLGRFFGRDHGLVYIVGIIVLIALIGLIVTIFCPSTPTLADGQKILAGIVTTGLGFFAGSAVKKSD